MKVRFLLAAFCMSFASNVAYSSCVSDEGPFEDDYGFAVFPFKNVCPYQVTVNLCVKSYVNGQYIFNSYSGTAYSQSTLVLTDGKWSVMESYQWSEDTTVSCPFY